MIKSESIIPLLTVCANSENTGCAQVGELSIEIIKRQKAEIERLEHIHKGDEQLINSLNKCYRLAKSEAIKEFAERLKENMRLEDDCDYDCENCFYDCNKYVLTIDNLVKEMTEEEE